MTPGQYSAIFAGLSVGFIGSNQMRILPVIVIFAATAWIALGIFMLGRKRLSPQPHLAAGETPVAPH